LSCTSRVTARPGFKVNGKVAPDIVKPVPDNVAELMITGAVPLEVIVTGKVVGVFTVTLPNARLTGLTVNVGTAGFNCRAKVFDTPPVLAVRVTDCAVVTEVTVAVNPALVALAGTTSVAGTVTAVLLLLTPTLTPPLPAAELRVTVQLSLPAPVSDALLQDTELNVPATAVPVPLNPTTVVPLVDELLWMVS
jgi:hypothetical protein